MGLQSRRYNHAVDVSVAWHVVFEIRERTDRHTHAKIAILCTPPGDKVKLLRILSDRDTVCVLCRLVVPCIRRTVLCRAWYRRSRDTGASRDGLLLLTDLPADWSDRTRVLLTIQVSVCHLIYSYRHVYLSNMHTWPLRLRLLRLARTLSAYRESNLINSTAL